MIRYVVYAVLILQLRASEFEPRREVVIRTITFNQTDDSGDSGDSGCTNGCERFWNESSNETVPDCSSCAEYLTLNDDGSSERRCSCILIYTECQSDQWGPFCSRRCNQQCLRNNGSCDGLFGNGTCICPANRDGQNCEKCVPELNFGLHCDQECPNCGEHGHCLNGPTGSGTCRCDRDYGGQFCEKARCGNALCESDQYCDRNVTANVTVPRCRCYSDFWDGTTCRDNVCRDVNGNDAQLCSHVTNSVCKPLLDSQYVCECTEGYRNDTNEMGEMQCQPIHPCVLPNICDADSVCRPNSNLPNGYYCACTRGKYRAASGLCETDPCREMTCGSAEECVRHDNGTATCDCIEGTSRVASDRCEIDFANPQFSKVFQQVLEATAESSLAYDVIPLVFNLSALGELARNNETTFSQLVYRNVGSASELNAEAFVKMATYHGVVRDGVAYNILGFQSVIESGSNNQILISTLTEVNDTEQANAPEGSQRQTRTELNGNYLDSAKYGIRFYSADFNGPHDLANALRLHQTEVRNVSWVKLLQHEASEFHRYLRMSKLLNVTRSGATIFVPVDSVWNRTLSQSDKSALETQPVLRNSLLLHHFLPSAVDIISLITHASTTSGDASQLATLALERVRFFLSPEKRICASGRSGALLGCVLLADVFVADNIVVHFIDGLLIPQSFVERRNQLGESRRCDKAVERNTTIRCTANPECPHGGELIKIERNCGQGGDMRKLQTITCRTTVARPECCDGHYGSWCLACPGHADSPCNNHGTCDSGYYGSGKCNCSSRFTGVACERCADNKFGINCDQPCTCLHGLCNSTTDGDGKCIAGTCQADFVGPNCDKKLINCSQNDETMECHHMAYCVTKPSDDGKEISAYCHCPPGYSGDGTNSCEEIDPCNSPNRAGCDAEADCRKVGPGQANCTCRRGWFGDGYTCYEATLCNRAELDTQCSEHAICVDTLPDHSVCICESGYWGNGSYCERIEPCTGSDSECGENSECSINVYEGKQCTCKPGYYGDGKTCLRTIAQKLMDMDDSHWFSGINRGRLLRMTMGKLDALEYGDRHAEYTVFIPTWRTLRQLNASMQAVAYHDFKSLVGCGVFDDQMTLINNETNGTLFSVMPSYNQIQLVVSDDGSAYIGGVRIATRNIMAANGVIHEIDGILPCDTDPNLFTSNFPKFEEQQFHTVSEFLTHHYQYTDFFEKMESTGLSVELRKLRRLTIFALTNNALASRTHLGFRVTKRYLSYYIVPELISLDALWGFARQVDTPSMYETVAGRYNTIGVMRRSVSWMITSDGHSDVARLIPSVYLLTSIFNTNVTAADSGLSSRQPIITALIYGVESPLQPKLGICDKVTVDYQRGACLPCMQAVNNTPLCLHHDYLPHPVAVFRQSCYYNFSSSSESDCVKYHICQRAFVSRQCCPGYFGPDCERECPGGSDNPCNSNGKCLDGPFGSGTCICYANYTGKTCKQCVGAAMCDADDTCNRKNGGCHPNATCVGAYDGLNENSEAKCVCNSGYHGNGIFCEKCVRDSPCLATARCIKTSGNNESETYDCFCPDGYVGDGERYCIKDTCKQWSTKRALNECWIEEANCSYAVLNPNNSTRLQLAVPICTCPANYVSYKTHQTIRCHGNVSHVVRRLDTKREFYNKLEAIVNRPLTVLYPLTYESENIAQGVSEFVADGAIVLGEGVDQLVRTMSGHEHKVTIKYGEYMIGQWAVVEANLPAKDGVVHIVRPAYVLDQGDSDLNYAAKLPLPTFNLTAILITASAVGAVVLATMLLSLWCMWRHKRNRRDRSMRQSLVSRRSHSIVSAGRSSVITPIETVTALPPGNSNTYVDHARIVPSPNRQQDGPIIYNPLFSQSFESVDQGTTRTRSFTSENRSIV